MAKTPRVGLGGNLPNGDTNGFQEQVDDLVKHPKVQRVGYIVYDVQRLNDDVPNDIVSPVIRIRHAEPIDDPAEQQRVLARIDEMYQERGGNRDPKADPTAVELDLNAPPAASAADDEAFEAAAPKAKADAKVSPIKPAPRK